MLKNSPESFGAFFKNTFCNVDNFIPRRMSDNICHSICYEISFHVTLGNDVIDNVTIAKLGFLLLRQDFIIELKTNSIFKVLVVWGC